MTEETHHTPRAQADGEQQRRVPTRLLRPAQLLALIGALSALSAGLIWRLQDTVSLLILLLSIIYVVPNLYCLALGAIGSLGRGKLSISAEQIGGLREADMPTYSVMVPIYREAAVVPRLIRALAQIQYPPEKLDILLLLEEQDAATMAAVAHAAPPAYVRQIIVPDNPPRTKPNACNFGLKLCRGQYVVVYDAEDIPAPDQLKKALVAFRDGPPHLFAVQAALNCFNSGESYLSRMLSLEFAHWFDHMLPGMQQLRLPALLGGSSNHFRVDQLKALGGWDAFNVTEDVDLAIRASAHGYTIAVINSTTYEEGVTRLGAWIRQRSRWRKGYLLTWLAQNRDLLRLLRRLGLKNWLSYQVLVGSSSLMLLANPVLWLLFFAWALLHDRAGAWPTSPALDLAALSFVVGNLAGVGQGLLVVFYRPARHLALSALSMPFYGLLQSVATYRALWQLFTSPFYWEKTEHGMTSVQPRQILDR